MSGGDGQDAAWTQAAAAAATNPSFSAALPVNPGHWPMLPVAYPLHPPIQIPHPYVFPPAAAVQQPVEQFVGQSNIVFRPVLPCEIGNVKREVDRSTSNRPYRYHDDRKYSRDSYRKRTSRYSDRSKYGDRHRHRSRSSDRRRYSSSSSGDRSPSSNTRRRRNRSSSDAKSVDSEKRTSKKRKSKDKDEKKLPKDDDATVASEPESVKDKTAENESPEVKPKTKSDSSRDKSKRVHKSSRRRRSSRSYSRSRSKDRSSSRRRHRRRSSRSRSRTPDRKRDKYRKRDNSDLKHTDDSRDDSNEDIDGVDMYKPPPWRNRSARSDRYHSYQYNYQPVQPRVPLAAPFKNDGSFLEVFKKMQETQNTEEAASTSDKPAEPVKGTSFIGKRRGGRVLKTGVVKKPKPAEEKCTEETPKDAWSVYMKEVKKYREAKCQEDVKTRSLVK